MIANTEQHVLSTEYFRRWIYCDSDPTGDVVNFAFQSEQLDPTSWTTGNAGAGTWKTNSWDATRKRAMAIINVGPEASLDPGAGKFYAYVKITDSPEVPVIYLGTHDIFTHT
jgi:hypothetical protein